MSKTIKVIDLYIMMAEGKEMPKQVKYNGIIYTYHEINKHLLRYEEDDGEHREFFHYLCGSINNLNDKLEIIEEESEIDIQSIEGIEVEVISQCDNWLQDENEEITEEINPYIIDCIRKNTLKFYNKINELNKAVKQLDHQINNKGKEK